MITENMAKLVKNPVEVAPFMPILAPLLEEGMEKISDPECRQRFQAASEVLNRVGVLGEQEETIQVSGAQLVVPLRQSMVKNGAIKSTLNDPVVLFVADVAAAIANVQCDFVATTWSQALKGT